MIDRAGRRRVVELLQAVLAGGITNEQFEDRFPLGSDDRALFAIFCFVWARCDDNREHTIEPDEETVEVLRRCARFLESGREYEWPSARRAFWLSLKDLVGARTGDRGEDPAWPFFRRADEVREAY